LNEASRIHHAYRRRGGCTAAHGACAATRADAAHLRVIEPVEIRNCLQIGLVLDELLGAAVEKTDVRIDALDYLTVEVQNEA
jgi:hypothetical protein